VTTSETRPGAYAHTLLVEVDPAQFPPRHEGLLGLGAGLDHDPDRAAGRRLAVVETQLGSIPHVLCHAGDLNQAFLALIVNAAQAMAERKAETRELQVRRQPLWLTASILGGSIVALIGGSHILVEGAVTVARSLGVAVAAVDVRAPEALLRSRITARAGDPSEATVEVLERQIATAEPISLAEGLPIVAADTASGATAALARQVAADLAALVAQAHRDILNP